MEKNIYQSLLGMSSIVEDAAYAVHGQYNVQGKVYAAGNSKCGSSSCASGSKCGNSRASSVSVRTEKPSKLDKI